MDLRDDYIARVVNGQSFADVGGLWGTVNERVSVAAGHGATSLAMIDISEPLHELWPLFRQRMESLGISDCQCIAADVCALAASESPPVFGVVHCSGVLYHHPNPLVLLRSLRTITARHLILTSAITQEVIENDAGVYRLPPSGAIFVPALSQPEREVLRLYWHDHAAVDACWGISHDVRWDVDELGPWWWLFTPRVMMKAAEVVGFRVVESGPTWNGDAHTVLLEAAQ